MMESNTINEQRRDFLKKLSQAVGYSAATLAVAGSGMSVALAYTPNPNSTKTAGLLFSQAQMKTLHDICATIIPATDTKSAAEVDCHGFVDNQLIECHSPDQQQMCVQAVELVQNNAQSKHNKAFIQLTDKQKTQVLRDIESMKTATGEQKAQFKFLKLLIVFGYFTSEEGATKALTYQPYPGGFKGSIPLNADTTSWGSLNYY